MARVRLTPRAREDLDEIWLYIAHDNMDAADHLIDALAAALAEIYSARAGIYQDMTPGILAHLDNAALPKALLALGDASPELAIAPGTFLLSRLARDAESIFKENKTP